MPELSLKSARDRNNKARLAIASIGICAPSTLCETELSTVPQAPSFYV